VPNLHPLEIKAFVPAKDYELSKRFDQDLGFTMASDSGGVAYFHFEHASFLLMDFYREGSGGDLTMHLLVEDVEAWWLKIHESGVSSKYGVEITEIRQQPWRMRDFSLVDPSGLEWQIAQNTD
jgi:uncharacterized glyoxalase superfamily protein PhnB